MMDFNYRVFQAIFSFAGKSPVLDAFGIFLAEYLPYFLVAGIFFFVFSYDGWRKRGALTIFFIFSLILSRGVIGYLISFFFPIDRPFIPLDFVPLVGKVVSPAFPAGYAVVFFTLAFALFCVNRSWGGIYFLAASVVSFGRIFVGVQWPLDILGGLLVAFLGTGISWLLFQPYLKKLLFSERGGR